MTNRPSPSAAIRLLQPFSLLDVGLSVCILSVVIAIWFAGDFHTLHHGDSVIFSLNSLYRWTPFVWEYDHGGMLLPLLVNFIKRPFLNVVALSAISSLMFLGGLAVWAGLLSFRPLTLAESSVWVSLFVPLILQKARIFANAAPGVTSGNAFFFGGVFVWAVVKHREAATPAKKGGWIGAMLASGFLAIYLSKLMLIPLAAIALLMMRPAKFNPSDKLVPLVCLAVALLALQLLESAVPFKNDYSFSIAEIPTTFAQMLKFWLRDEVTAPLWIVIPLAVWLYPPARRNSALTYFALGIVVETLIISSSRWVAANQFVSRYLYDLLFFTVLAAVIVAADLARRYAPVGFVAVAVTALVLNTYEWNSLRPNSPFADLDHTIGKNTPVIVEAGCDLLIGDFWKVWRAVLAVNDYYYRESVVDPRTGQTRLVAGIAIRAWPTEYLWRPRLSWPDAKICFFDEDERVQRAIQVYAPGIVLLMPHQTQVGPLVVTQLENRHLSSFGFEFDNIAPGPGWHGQEVTPDGQTFQWMKESASLVLPLATDRDLALSFRVRPALAPDVLPSLTLTVNDHPLVLTSRPKDNGDTVFESTIPMSALDNPRYTQLTFRVSRTVIPQEIYGNGDTRSLGLAFDWLRLDPAHNK